MSQTYDPYGYDNFNRESAAYIDEIYGPPTRPQHARHSWGYPERLAFLGYREVCPINAFCRVFYKRTKRRLIVAKLTHRCGVFLSLEVYPPNLCLSQIR